jgi:hypothetical protein
MSHRKIFADLSHRLSIPAEPIRVESENANSASQSKGQHDEDHHDHNPSRHRRSVRPAALFTRIAIWLTAASLIPPVLVDADVSTKAVLIVTHLIAAAIVIPVVAKRLTVR